MNTNGLADSRPPPPPPFKPSALRSPSLGSRSTFGPESPNKTTIPRARKSSEMSSVSLELEESIHSHTDSDVLKDNLLDDGNDNGLGTTFTKDSSQHLRSVSSQISGSARIVIAIDYGTTFTGLAIASTQSKNADLKKIQVLQEWTSKMSNQQKVRTMISYTKPLNGEAQWGTDVSDDATTMVNTKLELEPQDSRFDELDLTLALLKGTGNLSFENVRKAGPNPAYSCKTPTEIVTDYLTKVCESARKSSTIDQLVRTPNATVDIVVTVPVNWSYQATDSTFKAIRGAGFNKETFPNLRDTILVTEPEAASYFTARDLQESGIKFLEVNDCFILCDAGGGTVDVISYQVTEVKDHLKLERITTPKSDKCGSAFIDTAFKRWLRDTIGVEKYAELDPANARQRISPHSAESGSMRELIKRFEIKKRGFSNESGDIRLDLPAPLSNFSMEGRVREGELLIHWNEMKDMMDSCVNGVIELIEDQVTKIRKGKNRRVKNVFLVGGFGASSYLQQELQDSLDDLRGMRMRRPETEKSLTAVVQGAVIYGIEKSRHADARYMSAVMKSYGITTKGRFQWLIRKGDLVLSTEQRSIYSDLFWFSSKTSPGKKFDVPIFVYLARDKDDDDVPKDWEDGQHEVKKVGNIHCDLSKFVGYNTRPYNPLGHPSALKPGTQYNADIGPMKCHMLLSTACLEVQILHNNTPVGHCKIDVEVDQRREHFSDDTDD